MILLLTFILLTSLFVFDWLFFIMGVGGRIMTWIPEFIAIFIAAAIPFRTALSKDVNIPLKYMILIFLYLAHILSGYLLNEVTGWTMLAGLRIYTKFIPIFLMPLIFPYREADFKKILLMLFFLAMIQLPIVLWQRFIQFATVLSGDPIGGTLGISTSGILSIFLTTIISFIVAFYYREQIPMPVFLLSTLAALIPMTLNETKITFVLLPISFVFPALFISAKREAILKVLLIVSLFVVSFVVFKGIYDHFAEQRWGYGIVGFIAEPEEMEKYNKRRIDPIVNSFKVGASKDFRFAVFGHGAGNVSEGFTRVLSGKYLNERFRYSVGMTFVKLIWEVGILGMILFFLFPLLVFLDAFALCRQDSLVGAYALGMMSFSIFFVLSTFYTFTIDANVLIFLYFFAAGQVARLRIEASRITPKLQEKKVFTRSTTFSSTTTYSA